MKPCEAQVQMKIRFFDKAIHDWIKEQAKINRRTATAEVNYHLEQAMLKQQQETDNVSQPTQTN